MAMEQLGPGENLEELIRQSECCLLLFGDETCGPCHALRRRLNEWLKGRSGITARYVPVSAFRQAAAQMGVFTAPAVRIYIGGRLAGDEAGYFSLERMLDRAERYLDMV